MSKKKNVKKQIKQKQVELSWLDKSHNLKYILPIAIFIIGIGVRLVGIGIFPAGFNKDEASAGYDAFSILRYGMDRNGIELPIHLIAWGSGQNIAYSWICMPFIALFGLSEFSVRLPMAIVGSISVVVFYFFIKNLFDNDRKVALIGAFIFAIFPWHIMKSRWGLESNLFPDLILWGSYLLSVFCRNKKAVFLYASFFVFGFSAYSYGIAYCFLPFFIIPLLIYMYIRKDIKPLQTVIALAILFLITLPIMIFVVINTFDMLEMKFGFLTIPRLYENRHTQMASLFSHDFLKTSWKNFIESLKILIVQQDGLPWNSMPFYGLTYIVTLPFYFIGFYVAFSKKHRNNSNYLGYIMNFWFISSVILLFVVTPNINRINIIMIPFMYYIFLGINEITKISKYAVYIGVGVLSILFVMFTATYYTKYQNNIKFYFFYGLGDAIHEVMDMDVESIYITNKVNAPYIYTLFYTGANVHDYINTVEYNSKNVAFEDVNSFSNYKFYIPDKINPSEDAAYIVDESDINKFSADIFEFDVQGRYAVVTLK